MTYRPAFRGQADSGEFSWTNCLAAVGAMALDRDTRGARTTDAGVVRAVTGDRYGGLTLEQVDSALKVIDATRDHLDVRPKIPAGQAITLIDRGEGMAFIVNYGVIVDAGWNGNQSAAFRGAHGFWANERRSTGEGYEWLVSDPLLDNRRPEIPQAPRWMPQTLLLKAAASYAGTGYIQAAFTRDTEPSYRVHVHPTYFARYIVTNGVITGLRKQLTGGFITPVSAPKLLTYPPQIVNGVLVTHSSRSVVQIPPTRSEYGGWYIGSAGANVTLEVLP